MEKTRRIPDIDCRPHESISHAYWVRSKSKPNKKYLIIWHCTNFITCDCPWSIHGKICKHAIKVDWLHSSLMDSDPLLDLDTTPNTLNSPPEIRIEAPNLDADTSTTILDDENVEDLNLLREELFGYLDLFRNSPPSTVSKTKQLIDLAKKFVDDVNDLHIMDYDFTLGLGYFELSLKRNKSSLSPQNKNKRK